MILNKKTRIKYSQNYIKSKKLASEIVNKCNFQDGDLILEIGPGEGIFSVELLQRVFGVIAIEIDRGNINILKNKIQDKNFILIEDDILKVRLKKIDKKIESGEYKVFGNIPFNISSQIVKKILLKKRIPEEAFLIVQKEFAQRIINNNKKNKSLLHILLSSFYKMDILYNFQKSDFIPTPSVDTVLVSFKGEEIDNMILEKFGEYKDFVSAGFVKSEYSIQRYFKNIIPKRKLQQLSDKYNFKLKSKIINLNSIQWMEIFKHRE